jgi:hypothetical protein
LKFLGLPKWRSFAYSLSLRLLRSFLYERQSRLICRLNLISQFVFAREESSNIGDNMSRKIVHLAAVEGNRPTRTFLPFGPWA